MEFIKNWFKANQSAVKFTVAVFVIWQLAMALIIEGGVRFFPTTNQYLYTEKEIVTPPFLWSRANFDGIHYLDIARKGYGIYQQAFFPLYPRTISVLAPFFGGSGLLAGWTVSLISFFGALLIFHQLVKMDFGEKIARRAIITLLIFPTSFFFTMVYSESLFLLLVLAGFYLVRTNRWGMAALVGMLASATSLAGVFLVPAFLPVWWREKRIANLIFFLIIPLGLLIYMRFLSINYGDPLLFAHVQPYFGAERLGDKIVLLYQVFWRYLKMLITVDKFTPTYFVVILEAASGVLFLFLTVKAFIKKWYAYGTFMLLSYIAPTLTGTFSSMPRYVLTLFPGFILLAILGEKYRAIKILYPLICIPLFILSLLLFTRGYWIG